MDTKQIFTPSGSLPPASPSVSTTTNLTVSAPPPGARIGNEFFQSFDIITSASPLKEIERKIIFFIHNALEMKCANILDKPDDYIFLSHTILVKTILLNSGELPSGLELFPVRLWENHVFPMVELAEAELHKSNTAARIHKGAPFFNVAICLFLSRDFHRAYQYFAEAGNEDHLSGRGSRHLVPTGENTLAAQVIVNPLVRILFPEIASDYQAITNNILDASEFQFMIAWLVQRAPDAFQTIIALHRFCQMSKSLNNEIARYQLVRSLADLILPFESSLRRWQVGIYNELHDRTQKLLTVNHHSIAVFEAFHKEFNRLWPKPKNKTGAAVNWVITEATNQLKIKASSAERIGVGAYLIVRLRNSLMHINEEDLDIYKDPKLCLKVAGIALAMLRISKHGDDKTLSSI